MLLSGEIKSPPFSEEARRKAGFLLRMLQRGELLCMPDSRPMPSIGARCHELRIVDSGAQVTWRIIYRLDSDAVVIAEVFAKKTQRTPEEVLRRDLIDTTKTGDAHEESKTRTIRKSGL